MSGEMTEALRKVKEKAWDSGYSAAILQSKGITGPVRNPYCIEQQEENR